MLCSRSKDGELQDDDDHALENAQLKARFNAERNKAMRGDLSADIDPHRDVPHSSVASQDGYAHE